ncbi:hypothetical protein Q7P37_011366 [Cladosporium fusiforme]
MSLRSQDLAGKVALITGGTRGIGRAVALHLASRGCSILATCSRPESLVSIASLQSKVDQLFADPSAAKPPPTIIGIVADIYSPECPRDIADALSKHFADRVDIVVLNAAAAYATFVGQLDAKEVSESIFANVQTSAFIVDELVKRELFQPESRIVFVSSIRDRLPWKGQLIYSAGKAAGESMCRTWAEAFGGKHEEFAFMSGTTANAVLVGLTSTEAVNNMPEDFVDMAKNEFIPRQDLPRYGQADDVADAIAFLVDVSSLIESRCCLAAWCVRIWNVEHVLRRAHADTVGNLSAIETVDKSMKWQLPRRISALIQGISSL